MSISILNRGASGGLTASIIVKGLGEADTVTASNGSKTKNGVWNATEGNHEINGITDLGLWEVTATNGVKTSTQDVLVEVIGLYEIEMDYKLWLYREGEEFEDVTGGWIGVRSQPTNSAYPMGTATKNADNLYARAQNQSAGWSTTNAIDVTEYTNLKVFMSASGTYNCINLYTGTAYPQSDIARKDNNYGTDQEFTLDVSSVNGEYKVHLGCFTTGGSGVATMNIYKVWLE